MQSEEWNDSLSLGRESERIRRFRPATSAICFFQPGSIANHGCLGLEENTTCYICRESVHKKNCFRHPWLSMDNKWLARNRQWSAWISEDFRWTPIDNLWILNGVGKSRTRGLTPEIITKPERD